MRSPGSVTAWWASIRRTPGPPPRRRGSRWWRNCRGGVRRSGPRRRRGCGGRSTVNTSAAPGKRTGRSTTWWPVRPPQTGSCVSAGRRAPAERRSPGRWPPLSGAAPRAFRWPASRSRRAFSASPDPLRTRGRGASSTPCGGSAPRPGTPATTRWSSSAGSTGWAWGRPTRCSARSTRRAAAASATATSACRWTWAACCSSPSRPTPGASRRCCRTGWKRCRWPDTPMRRSSESRPVIWSRTGAGGTGCPPTSCRSLRRPSSS